MTDAIICYTMYMLGELAIAVPIVRLELSVEMVYLGILETVSVGSILSLIALI